MSIVYTTVRLLALAVSRIYFRLEVSGKDRFPREGAFLVAANHVSFVDPVVIGAACPRRLSYLMAEPVYRVKPYTLLYRHLGAIPVRRQTGDRRAFRQVLDQLQSGLGVVVFPEGSRSWDGTIGPAQPGVGLLASLSSVPLIPVAIDGAHEAFPRGSRFPRPRKIRITVGRPLPPPPRRREHTGESRRQIFAEYSERVMKEVAGLLDGADTGT